MGEFDRMTQNSNSMKFDMDFNKEIANFEFLKYSENFISYKEL